jgi:hypothetical protein
MLRGRFGLPNYCPYIVARLYLPRLGLRGDVPLVVDTGADSSILMPSDGRLIGLPYDRLEGDNAIGGVGGDVRCYLERAVFAFTDPGRMVYAYELDLDIMPLDATRAPLPSLLGRDIIARWRLVCDATRGILQAQVRSADMSFDLRKPLDA